jgi:ribosomal protein S27E
MMDRCPRQDPNQFKTDDIFEIKCPACGCAIEFFKDEAERKCQHCGQMTANPKLK